jgi:hypothetical protein
MANPNEGYIYLLREREFIRLGEETYKIGKTASENPFTRTDRYPNESKVILITSVPNCHVIEKELIKIFQERFTYMRRYGFEYFNGDVKEMKIVINDFVDLYSESEPKLKSLKKLCVENDVQDSELESTDEFVEDVTKYCPDCDNDLSLDKFGDYARSGDGKREICKNCRNHRDRKIRRERKEKKVENIIKLELPDAPNEINEQLQPSLNEHPDEWYDFSD